MGIRPYAVPMLHMYIQLQGGLLKYAEDFRQNFLELQILSLPNTYAISYDVMVTSWQLIAVPTFSSAPDTY